MTTMLPHPVLQALVGDEEVGAFFSNEAELSAMLRVEAALAEAEETVGLIDGEAARRIAETCRSFQADWEKLAEGLTRDGVDRSGIREAASRRRRRAPREIRPFRRDQPGRHRYGARPAP